jgi:hypothetical protein
VSGAKGAGGRPRFPEVSQGLSSVVSHRKARTNGPPVGESGVRRTCTNSAVGHRVELPRTVPSVFAEDTRDADLARKAEGRRPERSRDRARRVESRRRRLPSRLASRLRLVSLRRRLAPGAPRRGPSTKQLWLRARYRVPL